MTVVLFSGIIFTFILFSEIGLASPEGIVSAWFWPVTAGLALITAVLYFIALKSWSKKYEGLIRAKFEELLEEERCKILLRHITSR
ncbi:hypothetical protein [Lacicoccus qingdaonensis]|uniref:hypothetical protein n=1 Tax=Lacicoccus qingdaonensis TaxID=576118 RepID=UPI00115FDBC7|nr:hypothetical protein [Salinicoccus qingdaonensis]